MRRRELLLLLGGAMTVTRSPRAQQSAMRVIGFLGPATLDSARPFRTAFLGGLAETG